MNMVPLEQLTMESFSKWVKTRFRVRITPTETMEMELAEVTSPPTAPGNTPGHSGYESFSVIFTGPSEPVLPQRIYAFEGEGIGRFDLFIVPIGRDSGGARYQAAFNRLIEPAQAG
jgi:hypothetical protein